MNCHIKIYTLVMLKLTRNHPLKCHLRNGPKQLTKAWKTHKNLPQVFLESCAGAPEAEDSWTVY